MTDAELLVAALHENGFDMSIEEAESLLARLGPMVEEMRRDPEFRKLTDQIIAKEEMKYH